MRCGHWGHHGGQGYKDKGLDALWALEQSWWPGLPSLQPSTQSSLSRMHLDAEFTEQNASRRSLGAGMGPAAQAW